MTAHELARILLAGPDVPVYVYVTPQPLVEPVSHVRTAEVVRRRGRLCEWTRALCGDSGMPAAEGVVLS